MTPKTPNTPENQRLLEEIQAAFMAATKKLERKPMSKRKRKSAAGLKVKR